MAKNKLKRFRENETFQNIFQPKTYNEDSKKITQKLINTNFELNSHNNIMNETDRTIVGLLWHENIVDVVDHIPKNVQIPFYQIKKTSITVGYFIELSCPIFNLFLQILYLQSVFYKMELVLKD